MKSAVLRKGEYAMYPDCPSLRGQRHIRELIKLLEEALDKRAYGTVYEVNAFYMKNPGPKGKGNIPRIIAHEKMRMWVGLKPRWL